MAQQLSKPTPGTIHEKLFLEACYMGSVLSSTLKLHRRKKEDLINSLELILSAQKIIIVN
jgi:hypothetical protein